MAALDHCVIAVSDWDRSNAFYADVLGAEVVARGEGYVYRFGANQLNIHGPGVDGEPNAEPPVAPGGADLCFVWDGPIDRRGRASRAARRADRARAGAALRRARRRDERLLPRPGPVAARAISYG